MYAPKKSEVFPTEPILSVEGSIIEAQLLETLVLNTLNFIATMANRLRQSAGKRSVMEFGMRRAQGWAAIHRSTAAIIGGADSLMFKVFVRFGFFRTQAHSWVQSFDDELWACRTFTVMRPKNCVLLARYLPYLE